MSLHLTELLLLDLQNNLLMFLSFSLREGLKKLCTKESTDADIHWDEGILLSQNGTLLLSVLLLNYTKGKSSVFLPLPTPTSSNYWTTGALIRCCRWVQPRAVSRGISTLQTWTVTNSFHIALTNSAFSPLPWADFMPCAARTVSLDVRLLLLMAQAELD